MWLMLENGNSINMERLTGMECAETATRDVWSLVGRGLDGRAETIVVGARRECELVHQRLLLSAASEAVQTISTLRALIRGGR